jgi:hypothetical protein
MKLFLALSLGLVIVAVNTKAAEAGTDVRLIDDFDEPGVETGVFLNRGVMPPDTFATDTQSGLSNVVGGSREISMQYVSGGTAASFPFAIVTPAPSGFLTISNDTGTAAVDTDITITWDNNGLGLGDLNYDTLVDAPRFVIDLESPVAMSTTLTMIVQTQDMMTTQASVTLTGAEVPFTPVIIPFRNFTQPSLLNNPFQSISLRVTGDTGFNIAINRVSAQQTVPEPSSTMGILTISALGLATRLKKR